MHSTATTLSQGLAGATRCAHASRSRSPSTGQPRVASRVTELIRLPSIDSSLGTRLSPKPLDRGFPQWTTLGPRKARPSVVSPFERDGRAIAGDALLYVRVVKIPAEMQQPGDEGTSVRGQRRALAMVSVRNVLERPMHTGYDAGASLTCEAQVQVASSDPRLEGGMVEEICIAPRGLLTFSHPDFAQTSRTLTGTDRPAATTSAVWRARSSGLVYTCTMVSSLVTGRGRHGMRVSSAGTRERRCRRAGGRGASTGPVLTPSPPD
jgi:hypothetical protein